MQERDLLAKKQVGFAEQRQILIGQMEKAQEELLMERAKTRGSKWEEMNCTLSPREDSAKPQL